MRRGQSEIARAPGQRCSGDVFDLVPHDGAPAFSCHRQLHGCKMAGPVTVDLGAIAAVSFLASGSLRTIRVLWECTCETNQDLIASGRSPIVDEHWMQTFPETSVNEGETLVHHHLDCGPVAVPLPASVHGGTPGYSIWHSTC